eukprot:jgi/Botrbrau1/1420/Bobra.0063s0116.4
MLGRELISTLQRPLTTGAKYHKRILHVRGKIYKLHTENAQYYYEKLSVGQTAAAGMTPGAILSVPSDCRLAALYKLAKSCFGNRRQATADDLQELCKALADVPLETFKVRQPEGKLKGGLEVDEALSITKERPKHVLKYQSIADNDDFVIGIFVMGAGTCIPLHNHPGMTVLSRVLYGKLAVRGYDWSEPEEDAQSEMPRRARLELDETLQGGCFPTILRPTQGGNIHTFTAVTDCAVLDLLAPPYKHVEGMFAWRHGHLEASACVGLFEGSVVVRCKCGLMAYKEGRNLDAAGKWAT